VLRVRLKSQIRLALGSIPAIIAIMPDLSVLKHLTVILNPNAGKGKGKRLFARMEKLLKAQGLAFEVLETTGPGHATELARAAVERGATTVVAAGGDGTVREVVNGIAGSRAVLGIIPVGSGNDFCKSINLPRDVEAACGLIRSGAVRQFDLGRVGNAFFANAVGIGFDALVVVEANRIRWLRGLPLYVGSVFRAMIRYDCPRVTLELDGRRWEQSILLTACANGQYYGGGFHVAPEARPDDGLLDICVIDRVSRLTILHKLTYVIKGTHARLPEVKFYRARRVVLTSPDVLYVQADGDLLPEADPHRVEVELLPGALPVIVPARSKSD
jgi:YegS/Rv2252/BmrU family lipid kinase